MSLRLPRPLPSALTAAAAAVALLTAGGSPAADARPVLPSGSPAKWTRVTADNFTDIADVGLARGKDGVLHIIWTDGAMGKFHAWDTAVRPDGTVEPPAQIGGTYCSGTYPDATTTPGSIYAFWNGTSDCTSTAVPGTYVAKRPASGGSWDSAVGVTRAPSYFGDSVSAATGSNGRPWVAFVISNGFQVTHFGSAKAKIAFAKCCVYEPGIGVDSRTGATWLAYESLIPGHSGIYAQQLSAAGRRVGKAVRLPRSDASGVLPVGQRVPATGLGGGRPGVYTSYLSHLRTTNAVLVNRIGSKSVTTVAKELDVIGTTVTADPKGRLWVDWYLSAGEGLFVRRAAAGAAHFGPAERVGLPAGTSAVFKTYLNAQADGLDVVALLDVKGKIAYWITQVRPPA